MTLKEIEDRVAGLNGDQGFEFIFDLLRAYGLPKATITRLKKGTSNKAEGEDEVLLKGKVYFRYFDGDEDLHVVIDDAKRDEQIKKQRPRFLIVRDADELLALDTETDQTLDIAPSELPNHFTFFLPWAGIEKTQLDNVNYADVKAAEKMAKLYDEVSKKNRVETEQQVHDLNVFFSRLLFCFFAEDTGVFEETSFTNAIGSYTRESGEDAHIFFDELFGVLNMPMDERDGIAAHLKGFGYVNGKLFEREAEVPEFTAKARAALLECATLDWSQINPDIFGSMIQAVVHPSQREGLGMHYTSVENIMKVIRPLFLDELYEAYEAAADSTKKLQALLDRICAIQIFDPACGSGNFLIIAYKELRKLEHRILQRIAELDSEKRGLGLFKLSGIKLENFYGIEIDDFAHEIAILSLWLAKHQMNVEFEELFGAEIPLIPLKDSGNVVCGNATRLDWNEVCPGTRETYLCSNPPYLGSILQSKEHKADLAAAMGSRKFDRNLDYVCAWLVLGAEYVAQHGAVLGFVATNSISQGAQVGSLWPHILSTGVEIAFAHTSFKWDNSAKGNAGVTCVIVGLSVGQRQRILFSSSMRREVRYINPYLVDSGRDTIVHELQTSLSGLPPMVFGTRLVDGGHLSLNAAEHEQLVDTAPNASEFLKPYMGAQEFLKGLPRWCLYIDDRDVERASQISEIAGRLAAVSAVRARSPERKTRDLADTPNRFYSPSYREQESILIPRHSSVRREYIPMGFLDESTVVSDAANAIYDAEPWVFGLIQSRMHMVWVRAVAGRLKTDYRYSAVLVYNTFPVRLLTDKHKATLTEHAFAVLGAREQFPDKTLAELYDPDKMPEPLRHAHRELDEAVDRLYRKRPFDSDEERLEKLFEMYEAMTTGGELTLNAD